MSYRFFRKEQIESVDRVVDSFEGNPLCLNLMAAELLRRLERACEALIRAEDSCDRLVAVLRLPNLARE